MFWLGTDVGGTFTDFVVRDGQDRTRTWKVPSNRRAPLEGIAEGLRDVARMFELDLPGFLGKTTKFIHGTTFGINALLERKGARTALITTAGLRDALEMRRAQLKNQWDLFDPIAPVLVPRHLRYGVRERVNFRGEVLVPLDLQHLEEIGQELQKAGVEAVAVALLFSFQYPQHERTIVRWLEEKFPHLFISSSADIAPQIGNFERTSTTVINAFLGPTVSDYLHRLRTFLEENGYRRPIYLMQNNGGLSDLTTEGTYGARGLLSGPAGGARGARALTQATSVPHAVLADMGGTSFDVSLVRGAQNEIAVNAEVAGYPVALPMLDIRSIGVGGGSIASVDKGGMLRVGPRSAGAMPGPACYDLGGDEPTITDAALVLGLLNSKRFLAGRQRLNINRAHKAIEHRIASLLGIPVNDAAYAIYQVAAALMVDAIYLLTVGRGHDPREFSLMLYGGAAPLFAGSIASGLDIRTLVIPANSSVFSAEGMLHADLHADVVRSVLRRLGALEVAELAQIVEELKARGREQLGRIGVPPDAQRFAFSCDVRYVDQHHEIAVPFPTEQVGPDSLSKILASFHRLHERLYGYSEPGHDTMLVNVRMAATEVSHRNVSPRPQPVESRKPPVCTEVRAARWEEGKGFAHTPVYDGDELAAGDLIIGPAIIEKAYTTVVLPSVAEAALDSAHNIIIKLAGGRGS